MTASLEIEEIPYGLLIRSVRRGSVVYALLSAALAALIVFLLGRMYFHRPALIVLTVVAAIWGSARWWRAVKVELKVTDYEIQVIGHFRSGSNLNRHIPLSLIRRLEYRPDRAEGKSGLPGGLYVQQRWQADCVLPHLDEAQTQKAIDAIYRRFPTIPNLPNLPDQKARESVSRTTVTLDLGSPQKADATTKL
jgi:hypothetical protein